jgi:hypothetical protein
MPNYRNRPPKILWGAGFANTLLVELPLDNVKRGPTPRAGSSTSQAPSGVEDAWTVGTDYLLTAELRHIPRDATATATGWDGATGVGEFLTWARDKNLLRFYPDKDLGTFIDSYLVEPMQGEGEPEEDGTTRLLLKLRNPTTRYDGY